MSTKRVLGMRLLTNHQTHICCASAIEEADHRQQKRTGYDTDFESLDRESAPRSTALCALRPENIEYDITVERSDYDGRHPVTVQYLL